LIYSVLITAKCAAGLYTLVCLVKMMVPILLLWLIWLAYM